MHEDLVYSYVHVQGLACVHKRCVQVALLPGSQYNKGKTELGTFYNVLDVKNRNSLITCGHA